MRVEEEEEKIEQTGNRGMAEGLGEGKTEVQGSGGKSWIHLDGMNEAIYMHARILVE